MALMLKELALQYLKEQLEQGSYPPGSRISDFAIAKQIKISRTPVREAINRLVSEGVLEAVPHEGVFVKIPNSREIAELYELRELLEGHAAAVAAEREDEQTRVSLQETCQRMNELKEKVKARKETMLTEEETKEELQLDMQFHMALIRAADNRRLEKVISESRILSRPFELMEPCMSLEALSLTCEYHMSVLEAILHHDAPAARDAIRLHIRRSADRLLSRMEQYNSSRHAGLPAVLRQYIAK